MFIHRVTLISFDILLVLFFFSRLFGCREVFNLHNFPISGLPKLYLCR